MDQVDLDADLHRMVSIPFSNDQVLPGDKFLLLLLLASLLVGPIDHVDASKKAKFEINPFFGFTRYKVSHSLSSAFRSESKAILIIRSWKELSKVSKVSSCHGNHGELSHLATTTDNNCYRNRISDRSYFISLSWS